MTIRPYRDADKQAVVALWREVLPDDAPHNEPSTVIRLKLALERDLFFVADIAGAIIGTIMGGYDGHRGWLYAVAVKSESRHHGIGSALVRHAEAALATRGCLKINLQVRAVNAAVVAFYEKLGYKVEERISLGKRL